jgi:hypothetical protein
MKDRKKPGAAFWAAVALVAVLVGYPLSFGPANRIMTMLDDPDWALRAYWVVYDPIISLKDNGSRPVRDLIELYLECWGE